MFCLIALSSQFGAISCVDLKQRIDAFLKRSFRYGFVTQIFEIQTVIDPYVHTRTVELCYTQRFRILCRSSLQIVRELNEIYNATQSAEELIIIYYSDIDED